MLISKLYLQSPQSTDMVSANTCALEWTSGVHISNCALPKLCVWFKITLTSPSHWETSWNKPLVPIPSLRISFSFNCDKWNIACHSSKQRMSQSSGVVATTDGKLVSPEVTQGRKENLPLSSHQTAATTYYEP